MQKRRLEPGRACIEVEHRLVEGFERSEKVGAQFFERRSFAMLYS